MPSLQRCEPAHRRCYTARHGSEGLLQIEAEMEAGGYVTLAEFKDKYGA